MPDALERLLHRLRLRPGAETDDGRVWHGEAGLNALNMNNRLFGGMVAAQTVMAAGSTHPDRTVHSLHQAFLRAGRADVGLAYRVTTEFVGGTYTGVRVDVRQDETTIAHALVGLTSGVGGPDRQDAAPPRTPMARTVNRDERRRRRNWDDQPVELRVDPGVEDSPEPDLQLLLRPTGAMPDELLIHQAVLAFATDRGLMQVAWYPERSRHDFKGSTVDHTIWFHRPFRFDSWFTHTAHSPTLGDGRGLVQGQIHDPDGVLVATTTQQGTFRAV